MQESTFDHLRGMTFIALLLAVATLLLLAGVVLPPSSVDGPESYWDLAVRELAVDGGDLISSLPADRRFVFGTGPLPEGIDKAEGCPWARAVTLSKGSRRRFPRGPFGRALLLVPSSEGVLLMSAGENGKIETQLGQVQAGGDDLIEVIVSQRSS